MKPSWQQIKNMILILYISQGIPMLLMGDEMGRTQLGNNNAYCQDNLQLGLIGIERKILNDVFFSLKYDKFKKSYLF